MISGHAKKIKDLYSHIKDRFEKENKCSLSPEQKLVLRLCSAREIRRQHIYKNPFQDVILINDNPYAVMANGGEGFLKSMSIRRSSSLVENPEYHEPQQKKRRVRDNRTRQQRKDDNLKKGKHA